MKNQAMGPSFTVRITRRISKAVIILVVLGIASSAFATARSWNTNSSGSAAVSANWSPSGMPNSSDDLTFARTTNYTVTFDSNVTLVNSHTYRSTNQVTLNLTTPHAVSSFITLGTVAGDDPIVVMNAGNLDCGGHITLGGISGATGRLTLANLGTEVHTTGTTDDVIVGGTGEGFLTLTSSALVESKDDIIIGSSTTGDGTVNVSGGTGSFPNLDVSTIKTSGSISGSNIFIGSSGVGVLNLSNGGLADSIDDILIGSTSTGNGTVTLGGAFNILSARLHAAGNIEISRNDLATATGTALVTVNPVAIVDADNQLRIGDPNGGSGTLHIDGGSVFCQTLLCDQTGHATLTFDDGTLTIDGGTMTPPATSLTLDGAAAGDDPTLKLNNGATFAPTGQLRVGNTRTAILEVNSGSLLDLSGSASAPLLGANAGGNGTLLVNGTGSLVDSTGNSLNVGLSGTGTLTIQNAGEVITGDTVIGSQASAVGTATVNGANSLLNVGSILRLATSGQGTLNVQNGGDVLSTQTFVGTVAGSNGSATVTNTGSTWQTGNMFVGGSNSASGGTGLITVSNGGNMSATGTAKVWPNGQISVAGTGVFASTSALELQGDLVLSSGGTVNADVNGVGGAISGTGTVNGKVNLNTTGTASITSGTLTIGTAASTNGVSGTGTVIVNSSGIINLADANTVAAGDYTLNGGTLNAVTGIELGSGDVLSGTGVVNADIFMNGGSITPTGASGLTFNKSLRNTSSGSITGTRINFGSTGSYIGSGTCQADIAGSAGSSITATGTLSIGQNTSSGFSFNGALDVGGNIVTLLDTNGAVLGGTTTLNSGRIECPAGIGNQLGGTITGDGLMVGTLTNSGLLDPHNNNPSLGGLMTVQGNLICNPSGTVDIEIGDTPASGDNDRINVSGTVSFNGTIRISLKNGFVPRVGQQFIAINAAGGRSGTFSGVIAPTGVDIPCNNVTFVMVYSSTAAIVLIRPPLGCTALGDLNSDGGCNPADIPILIDALLNGPYDACADLNGDCVNDGQDIQIFMNCLL